MKDKEIKDLIKKEMKTAKKEFKTKDKIKIKNLGPFFKTLFVVVLLLGCAKLIDTRIMWWATGFMACDVFDWFKK